MSFTEAFCETCRVEVGVDDSTGRYVMHSCASCGSAPCKSSGKRCDPSRLPGWHPLHCCGMFCDGQDGSSSQCAGEKRTGPPSIIDRIGGLHE